MRTLSHPRDKHEILERLRNVQPGSTARWGEMSVHQMICHLADAFRMAMGEMPVKPVTGPLQRSVLKWVAIYLPMRWPPRIRTTPEIDQRLAGTKPIDFAADVARLEALLEAFSAPTRSFDLRPHPIFGPLSDAEWLRWGWLHMDHHLRQFGA